MSGQNSVSCADIDRFQCAFVAFSYLLDRRGPETLLLLKSPGVRAQALWARLMHAERPQRAEALAAGLTSVVVSLDHRRLT